MFKRILIPLTVFVGMFLFGAIPQRVHAGTLYIENYDVDITVHSDSTFEVTETISYRATGEFHRIWREITLEDYDAVKQCQQNPSLQCGGFSYINVTGIFDEDGYAVPFSEISEDVITVSGEDRLRILWEYAPEGRQFNDELFTWTVEYMVYGGIGFTQEEWFDLFYWDVFYPDREYIIENASCLISFPDDISFDISDLQVFYGYGSGYDYEYDYNDSTNTLKLEAQDLGAYEDFTVLLRIPDGIIQEHAYMDLTLSPDTQDLEIDGVKIKSIRNEFGGIPPGKHELVFSAGGYKPVTKELTFASGERKEVSVQLERDPVALLLIGVAVFGNVMACFGGIILIGLVILNYVRKGKDIGGKKTIVPWFKPPDGISPVLVGSVKDEKVHLTDITATIINAAVRGFIKIKETGKKKYELIQLKEFVSGQGSVGRKIDYTVLDDSEVNILNDIFGGDKTVTTESLKNKFYTKIPGINDTLYAEMVNKGYFKERPDHVRRNHLLLGIGMIILGGLLTVGLGFLYIFTCGPGIIIAGIFKAVFSFFMPAKTKKGTEIFERAKGFRMYLHTAERYRVKQQLTPDLFEKYLPYAMVFGVEKQWAKNFENIYTQPPGWYEGRGAWDTFNTIYLVNALSSVNSNVGQVMASTPQSSGSGWSGGGWSGGGGFSGGFGGGGGGGGGGGMS